MKINHYVHNQIITHMLFISGITNVYCNYYKTTLIINKFLPIGLKSKHMYIPHITERFIFSYIINKL